MYNYKPTNLYGDKISDEVDYLVTSEKEKSFLEGKFSGFHLHLELDKIKLELYLYNHDKEKLFQFHRSINWIFGDLDDYDYILVNYKYDSDILNKIKAYRKYD
jgi:hypothetical protein